ncbi:hypothetical protein B296_00002131 [Ensete ventricosum]|uniref:RING-type domain-containing protein n=1 Tax=Ensete ventricosum TaxID=4639 RepID=A0A427B9X1_ENSVE|nr:hypothetical protein B296_00002131 [Ensete ventricosum]
MYRLLMVQPKPLLALNGQVCEICGDEIGLTVDGDLFVACNECGFPVCRPCYEYERREGTQLCPQCKTRYKRLKAKQGVEGGMKRRMMAGGKNAWMSGNPSKASLEVIQMMQTLTWHCMSFTANSNSWMIQQPGNLGSHPPNHHLRCRMDEARQPLSRKVAIASSKINPYRMVIVLRLVVLGFFLRYRILHPVHDAIGLWLTSIICEIWFAFSWILDQFPK